MIFCGGKHNGDLCFVAGHKIYIYCTITRATLTSSLIPNGIYIDIDRNNRTSSSTQPILIGESLIERSCGTDVPFRQLEK